MSIIIADTLEKSIIESVSDGEGYRLVLFTCGCPHKCIGCHNPETWDISKGHSYEIHDVVNFIRNKLDLGFFDGLTISGGDPFYQNDSLYELLKGLKDIDKNLNIWVYTGYVYEEIKSNPCLKYINVLVDGKFQVENKTRSEPFKGSSNQRLINLN